MKKIFLFTLIWSCHLVAWAQSDTALVSAQNNATNPPKDTTVAAQRTFLKGLSVGMGVPLEFYDLEAGGVHVQVGYDYAHPITDKFGLGAYVSAGGGFLRAFHPYNQYDANFSILKLSAGVLAQVGDLKKQPFLIGVSPFVGMGLVDMDLFLPFEIRFGRMFANRWYVMGEIVYGVSLAEETKYFEPSIRVGYNFWKKKEK